jgi:hypothetical protein
MTPSTVLRTFSRAAVVLACINVAVISVLGGYDLGMAGLVAHSLFKPLQYLNGAVLLAMLAARKGAAPVSRKAPLSRKAPFASEAWFALALLLLTFAIYWPSLPLNFEHREWTHIWVSEQYTSLRGLASLLATPQPDGFYRPLGFLSLWVDHLLFGQHFAGYHLQSLMLHALNAFLAYRCFRALGFSEWCSQWAALLFCAAAVCFEPLVWPAARFDLLAVAFLLSALLAAIEYMSGRASKRALAVLALCFAASLASKETAFALPVFAGVIWLARDFKLRNTRRLVHVELAAAALIAASLAVRISIYGGLGGYGWNEGTSPHFAVTLKTAASLLTRAFATPQFTINSAAGLPVWMRVAVILFAAGAAISAWSVRGQSRSRQLGVLGLIVASALVVNIIGWIGPSAAGSRYLYLPAIWMFLFLASAVEHSRASTVALSLLLAANCAGALTPYSCAQSDTGAGGRVRRNHPQRRARLAGVRGTGDWARAQGARERLDLRRRGDHRAGTAQPAWHTHHGAPAPARGHPARRGHALLGQGQSSAAPLAARV